MNAAGIRFWLIRKPRAHSLRVTAGSNVTDIAIPVGTSWAQLARTVEALAPDLIEALDGDGKLIRATRDEEIEPSSEEATPPEPPALPAVASDPETARFELFARLYSNGVQAAMIEARLGQEAAFTKLVDIANIMGKRGESLEKSLAATERMLFNAQRQVLEAEQEIAAQAAENPLNDLIAAVAEGAGKSKHATNGKA